MSEAFDAAAHLIDRHLTGGRKHRTAVAGPRGELTHAEPAGLRNRVAAGPRAIGYAPRNGSPAAVASCVHRGSVIRIPRCSWSLLAPREDTWSAQRIKTPVWKAWKGVSA
jgi:hypothetical protein